VLTLRPLDDRVPIQQQLGTVASPVVLVNVFTVCGSLGDSRVSAGDLGRMVRVGRYREFER
jgi:hypothetical protein